MEHPAARQAEAFEQGQQRLVGLAHMQDHRFVDVDRQRQLGAEQLALQRQIGAVDSQIQPAFTDGHALRTA